jgi:hypothetical protein
MSFHSLKIDSIECHFFALWRLESRLGRLAPELGDLAGFILDSIFVSWGIQKEEGL